MYRLDLSDQRLVLPAPVYQLSDETSANSFRTLKHLDRDEKGHKVAFFALNRAAGSALPVYAAKTGKGCWMLEVGSTLSETEARDPLFYAIPADAENPPATTVPPYEFMHEDNMKRVYSTNSEFSLPGYLRPGRVICRVYHCVFQK